MVGCSTIDLAASAAVVAHIWGILPPTERGMGELIPSFGRILDMPVVYQLSNYVFEKFLECSLKRGVCVFKTNSYYKLPCSLARFLAAEVVVAEKGSPLPLYTKVCTYRSYILMSLVSL